MNKYKIEITKTYCIDILSDETDYEKLQDMASEILDQKMLSGTEHYNQTGDTEYSVYDVTGSDDPFNAENE